MAGQLWNRMAVVALALTAVACGDDYSDGNPGAPDPVQSEIVSATGSLATAIGQFRTLLGGDSSNKVAGEQLTGRREINWEAVNGVNLNVNTFPADLFNATIPRGQVFSTPGTGLRASDNRLADIDSALAQQFNPFSGSKIFTAIGSTDMDVHFQVAGAVTPALVNGFGVVFSDVDVAGSSYLEFYSAGGTLLQKVNAPVRSDSAGHSFVGVVFEDVIVGRVRVHSGQAPVAAGVKDITAGGASDLVVVDDFIGGEPHP